MGKKVFDVAVSYRVAPEALGWPDEEDLASETLGGNRDYCDFDDLEWDEVVELIQGEKALIAQLYLAPDVEKAYEDWLEEIFDDFDGKFLGLDLGVNALTAALKALGCLPFYSCNGGAFGGCHNDDYPLVAFFCTPELLEGVMASAKSTEVGLEMNHAGGVTAYARDVEALIAMAESLSSRYFGR
jgi:hypothetical protein